MKQNPTHQNNLLETLAGLPGTPFQKSAWRELISIPRGTVRTYTMIARRLGKPLSVRAVGNACGKNPLPITIPCHRAIRSDGTLGGYSAKGSVSKKRDLLLSEGVDPSRLLDFIP